MYSVHLFNLQKKLKSLHFVCCDIVRALFKALVGIQEDAETELHILAKSIATIIITPNYG